MIKELRLFKFDWDESQKILWLTYKPDPQFRIGLPKTTIFSLNRFLIRIFAKEGRRKRVKR